jgi:hypothetical protein
MVPRRARCLSPGLRQPEIPVAAVVKLAEAKAHLSELLAKVERGEEFVIAPGKAADCPPWAP